MSDYIRQSVVLRAIAIASTKEEAYDSVSKMSGEPVGKIAEIIDGFMKYQIDWLKGKNDVDLDSVTEGVIVQFLRDTADLFKREAEDER